MAVITGTIYDDGGAVYNVKAFGAMGDGQSHPLSERYATLADAQAVYPFADSLNDEIDWCAIQAAILAAGAVHGTVLIPATSDHYLTNKTLTISAPVLLMGEGGSGDLGSSSPIWINSATADVFSVEQGSQGSRITNLSIRVNGTAGTPTAGAAIRVNFTSSIDGAGLSPLTIDNIAISNVFDGIVFENANNAYVHDVNMADLKNDGIFFAGGLGYYLSECWIGGAVNAAIEIGAANNFHLTDVQTVQSQYGLLVNPPQDTVAGQIFAKAFVADSMTSDAIRFDGEGSIAAVEFVGSWASGFAPALGEGGYGINFANSNLDGFIWIGGWIRESYLAGVNIAGGKNIFFLGATFSANGQTNPSHQPGIQVAANQGSFHVHDCIFGATGGDDSDIGNQTPGLLVPAGSSSNWSFLDNIASGGPAGMVLLQDASTGSKYVRTQDKLTVGTGIVLDDQANTTGNAGIEIGDSSRAGKVAFLDFHYGTGTQQDFNVRFINDANNRLHVMFAGGTGTLLVDGKVQATGGLGVGNSAAASRLGSVVRKMEVFDASGASLGFVPIYNTIS